MKWYSVFMLVFLWVCTSVGTYAQITQSVSATYLGLVLIDQSKTDKMSEICRYYKLTEESPKDGYHVFRHPDGTVFRFKVDEVDERAYPEVIVELKKDQNSVNKILTEAGYNKTSDGYVKGTKFEHRRTRCKVSSGSNSTLTFTKEYRKTDE